MRTELPSGTAAELVHPSIGPSPRGLVVIPDVMGMRPLFDGLVARLATEWGLSVATFEIYPGREDLDVAARLAAASTLAADRVGILGFCMGGMYALKAVSTGRFDRHCPFYGMVRVPEAWQGPGQGEPLDALAAGDASTVLAVVGAGDAWTPSDEVDDLEATGATVVRYADADHGFVHDPDRPAHRAGDAADAWRRVEAWLDA